MTTRQYTVDLTAKQADALTALGLNPTLVQYARYAVVRFPGASRDYTYRIPQWLTVREGDRVTVNAGVFADGSIGTVIKLTDKPPPVSYTYDIRAVA